MRGAIVFLILVFPVFLTAQTTKITGTVPGAEGRRIELTGYADLITQLEKTIAQATVDSMGAFTLTFNLDKTIYAFLNIEFHRGELFLEPSKTYHISIAPMNYNEMQEINPYIESQSLDIQIIGNNPAELNGLIQSFNKEYNAFVLEHFNELYRDKDKAKLDTFRLKMIRKFPAVRNDYFSSYSFYKTGSLEQVANVMGKAPMVKKYFSDLAVLYENIEYMDLFREFFTKYITATCRQLKFLDYKGMLGKPNSYELLMKALEADTLLRKPQVREMVLLWNMMEMYGDPEYKQETILSFFAAVQKESKFPQHKQIAEDMILVLTRLKPGTPAPDFTLTDRNRKKISLGSFRGKPVLLGFWTTYCPVCLSEMELLKPIYDKYHDRMNILSISADKEYLKMLYFINLKKDFSWNFLHLGNETGLLKEYDVKSFPLFVLIDSMGKIVQCPADLPDSGLEADIEKLLNP